MCDEFPGPALDCRAMVGRGFDLRLAFFRFAQIAAGFGIDSGVVGCGEPEFRTDKPFRLQKEDQLLQPPHEEVFGTIRLEGNASSEIRRIPSRPERHSIECFRG